MRHGVGTESRVETAAKTIYTCPMHPEIEQDHPGDCPKCGMALEPKTVVAESDAEEDNSELRDMTRRFWIGGALALPVFVVAMAHLVPAWRHAEWAVGRRFALGTISAEHAGGVVGGLAVLCARLAFA
jgi:hypothetical protein